MVYLKVSFAILAVLISIIAARHMVGIHGAKAVGGNKEEIIHDYILNFLGSLLGWFSLYFLIFFRLGQSLEITDLILILVAYVGITGYLPHIIINKGFKP
jgi:hypothetical protein